MVTHKDRGSSRVTRVRRNVGSTRCFYPNTQVSLGSHLRICSFLRHLKHRTELCCSVPTTPPRRTGGASIWTKIIFSRLLLFSVVAPVVTGTYSRKNFVINPFPDLTHLVEGNNQSDGCIDHFNWWREVEVTMLDMTQNVTEVGGGRVLSTGESWTYTLE